MLLEANKNKKEEF